MLIVRGHPVRGTTRKDAHAREIEAAGAEAVVADPDRIATLMPAIDRVGLVCVLLGSARGEPEKIEALHGPRLEMLIARLIDTTVRGVVYEARGSVPARVLADGEQRARRACERSRLPFALLDVGPDDYPAWLASAVSTVERLLNSEEPRRPDSDG